MADLVFDASDLDSKIRQFCALEIYILLLLQQNK